MRTILRTNRIRAGLYISLDGNWRIRRESYLFGDRKRWTVERLQSGRWELMGTFYSLKRARAFIERQEFPWAEL